MLKYKIISEDNEKIIYRYYPEGKQKYGEIYVNKITNDYGILERNYDHLPLHDWYMGHMFARIRTFIQNNSFDKSGMIAWY